MTRPGKTTGPQRNKMSRQPPLPPGLPPKPASLPSYSRYEDSYGGGDSYRPSQQPGGNSYHPRAQPQDVYQFGAGNAYRPSYDSYDQRSRSPPRNNYAPGTSRNDNSYRGSYNQVDKAIDNGTAYRPNYSNSFDFRYDAPPGLDYNAAESHRRRSPPRQRDYARDNHNRRPAIQSGHARGGPRGGYRGRAGPRLAADREFLKTNRAPTPELMPGMDEDVENGAKYRDIDEMSDSEEVDMDMSDDDSNDAQQPKKKQVRTDGKAADGDSVPRWSNPDPYTALPPPDESRGKKKDVVKLIRKARVTSSSEHASKPAATDDFISFDFGDEEEEYEPLGAGVEGAPTGPRELSGSANQVSLVNPAALNTFHQDERSHVYEPQVATKAQFNGVNLPRGPAAQNQQSQPSNQNTKYNSGNDISFNIKQKSSAAPAKEKNIVDLTSDPSLGSRKRNFRDEIKPPPMVHAPTPYGKNISKPASGNILNNWRAIQGVSASPWLGLDHSDSANLGVWLHKEIVDFYDFVKPRDFEQQIRLRLVQDLQSRVKQNFDKDDEIHPFGSFPAGLYLPTADMDLVCISTEFTKQGRKIFGVGPRGLRTFQKFLQDEGLALDKRVETIIGAKVPLVKYVDKLTGLKVDISFENITGITANTTFQNWKEEFPAMPILVTLIKHILAMRGLNEPVNGGIGGFAVTCLVVSLLQHMPQVQSRSMIPEHHLGEILMEFLDLYGNEFNTTTTAISMNPPSYISKNRVNIPYRGDHGKFMIIDPNRSDNDITGGSRNTSTIRKCFSDCFNALQRRMADLQRSENRSNRSILDCIIGGNYSSFELQRAHLAHVHEKLYPQSP